MGHSARSALAAMIVCVAFAAPLASPQPASANLFDTGCSIMGTIGEGWMGKVCKGVAHPGRVVGVVKRVLGSVRGNVLSPSGAIGIAAIVAWAVGGAHFVLSETARLVGATTSPELNAAWFSSVYWRVAAVAALLTLPFLCAAAIQAILRSDGALLARAVFGYLPVSFLATGIAAPLAMLLLQLTDWMGTTVAQAAGDQGSHFLVISGIALGTLGVAIGSPFVTFLIALLIAAGGLILWLELLIREVAVYIVVLMLPLVFTAMVWPARRVWAVRSVEVLVALILAKFAIVSVLALAATALGHSGGSLIVKSLAGLVLVILGAFAPWVLLRLLPLAEVASAAVGHVRGHAQARVSVDAGLGRQGLSAVGDGVASVMGRMHAFNVDATQAASTPAPVPVPSAGHDRSAHHRSEATDHEPVAAAASSGPTPGAPARSGETVPVTETQSLNQPGTTPGAPTAPDPSRADEGQRPRREPEAPAAPPDPVHDELDGLAALDDDRAPRLPKPDPETQEDQ